MACQNAGRVVNKAGSFPTSQAQSLAIVSHRALGNQRLDPATGSLRQKRWQWSLIWQSAVETAPVVRGRENGRQVDGQIGVRSAKRYRQGWQRLLQRPRINLAIGTLPAPG